MRIISRKQKKDWKTGEKRRKLCSFKQKEAKFRRQISLKKFSDDSTTKKCKDYPDQILVKGVYMKKNKKPIK